MDDLNNEGGVQDDSLDNAASGEDGSSFSIPDEYKDKGWTKFFDGKTGDDLKAELFKSYDNSQTLIGKKVEDYLETADLKSLENFDKIKEALTKQIAPEFETPDDIKGYNLQEVLSDQLPIAEATLDAMAGKFKELGINTQQGQEIFKEYLNLTMQDFEKISNPDDLERDLTQMFNGNNTQRTSVESLIKEFLPEEDRKIINDIVPNSVVEMFYKVAKGCVEKYGYKEGSNNSTNGSGRIMSQADKDAEYERIVEKMEALSRRPHTDAEMSQLQKELNRIFGA